MGASFIGYSTWRRIVVSLSTHESISDVWDHLFVGCWLNKHKLTNEQILKSPYGGHFAGKARMVRHGLIYSSNAVFCIHLDKFAGDRVDNAFTNIG